MEMPGSCKAWKSKNSFSPLPTPPLEISPKAGEIPTFPQPRVPGWKRGKPPTGFPLSHVGRATTATVYMYSESKTKQRDRPLRGLFSLLRITLEWEC
jgi:hypothetical protein